MANRYLLIEDGKVLSTVYSNYHYDVDTAISSARAFAEREVGRRITVVKEICTMTSKACVVTEE